MTGEGFYLGAVIDAVTGEHTDTFVDYEPADLTTHGVIVGMTGSGKTGLGVVFLEEALLRGVPALIIDPKGDMTNLLLTFPDLSAMDFAPWLDPGEAERAGVSVTELAERKAEQWSLGLAEWQLSGDRIAELRETAAMSIYTPGSTAGVPIDIVGSLADPGLDWAADAEILRDQIQGFASGLLGLLGIAADPIASKEHILIVNLVEHAWREGRDLDLARLLGDIQDPPIRKLGVFELDSFYPETERKTLAMRLNGLLASPAFAEWTTGAPLDPGRLLWDADGRPRAAIIYLAHLSDEERQFVVTLLLSAVVTWMRRQSGTNDLRAVVYMDEIFGFVPPVAEPPAKKPILTLMKQARAFGVGMLLSTQNPVDLDYKALSNAGTWCIGRLQTERDKARVLEGLASAAGGVDVPALDAAITGLDKRQFILHRAGGHEPVRFTTRWAMSYLAGPLTRDQVANLMSGEDQAAEAAATTPAAAVDPVRAESDGPSPPGDMGGAGHPAPAGPGDLAGDETPIRPPVADGVLVRYVHPSAPWLADVGGGPGSQRHRAHLAATVQLTYDETRADLVHHEEFEAILPLGESLDRLVQVDFDDRDFRETAPHGIRYVITPDVKLDARSTFTNLERDLVEHLYRRRTMTINANAELKLYSRPGESPEEFAARCDAAAQERADSEAAKLRDKYATKLAAAEKRFASADRRVSELEADVRGAEQGDLLEGAESLLGILTGSRRTRSVTGSVRRRQATASKRQRLETAKDKAIAEWDEMAALEHELRDELEEINDRWEDAASRTEQVEIGLEKSDIHVSQLMVVWIPVT